MTKVKGKLSAIVFAILTILAGRVNAQDVEMADSMRSDGKIYVVVVVAAIVVLVMSFYMISIDRKVSRLEKEKSGKQK